MAIPDYVPDPENQHRQRSFGVVFLGLAWAHEHGAEGHLTAEELVHAITDMAEQRWGLMTPIVLEHLDLGSSEAIGQVVEKMIELSLISRSPTDSLEDFNRGVKFTDRFALSAYKWQVSPRLVETGLSEPSVF